MRALSGSRSLFVVCLGLTALLAALAVVQYRWSTRVAAADAQREREHLTSAAALFENEFNGVTTRAMQFLQRDAHEALNSGQALTDVPKLLADLYYLEVPEKGSQRVRRLTADGSFVAASMPEWMGASGCAGFVREDPPALISPVFDVVTTEGGGPRDTRVLRMFRRRMDECFAARIDQAYLRDKLFPQLIRKSFGETVVQEYDFAVVSSRGQGSPLYGAPVRADLRKPFFPLMAHLPMLPDAPFGPPPQAAGSAVLIQRMERASLKGLAAPDVLGLWVLEVAHKGIPMEAAFERTRRRNLLLSLGVELLVIGAIVFLVVGSRRMQRLADQKMRFVAGVSHELRTPVSAIAMLSRNQADGLVSGEKVKQYGELIHQQSRRLNEMVEQTLAYAGIHSGMRKPERNAIDLARLIQEAVTSRQEELSRRGFDVEIALPSDLPPVGGDGALLRTAFDNLLDNALKHAEGGRWIRVSARYVEEKKEVRLSVEDRGPGIDPMDQAAIFEPFSRGRAAVEAQIPGSGLGLSLVRSAAEAHRGSVTLVSEPGRGSTFTMHLPV